MKFYDPGLFETLGPALKKCFQMGLDGPGQAGDEKIDEVISSFDFGQPHCSPGGCQAFQPAGGRPKRLKRHRTARTVAVTAPGLGCAESAFAAQCCEGEKRKLYL